MKTHGVRDTFFAVSSTPFLCSFFPLGGGHLCVPSPVLQFLTWPQTARAVSWAIVLAGCPLTPQHELLVSVFRHNSIIFTPVKVYFHPVSLPFAFS